MPASSTTQVLSRDEFLSKFAVDHLAEKARKDKVIAYPLDGDPARNKGAIREVEVSSDTFSYGEFSPANLTREESEISPMGDTPWVDKNMLKVPGLINTDFRFGARYTPRDVKNAGGNEQTVQVQKTAQAVWTNVLNYNIKAAAVANSGTKTAPAAAFWNLPAADPVLDFQALAQNFSTDSLGFLPDCVVIPLQSIQALKTNEAWRKYVKGFNASGMMGIADIKEAISAIFATEVDVYISNQGFNAAARTAVGTVTPGQAWTHSSVYAWYRGAEGDPESPSGITQFCLRAEEGIFVSDDPQNSKARQLKVVEHKLARVTKLTSDVLVRRITGTLA